MERRSNSGLCTFMISHERLCRPCAAFRMQSEQFASAVLRFHNLMWRRTAILHWGGMGVWPYAPTDVWPSAVLSCYPWLSLSVASKHDTSRRDPTRRRGVLLYALFPSILRRFPQERDCAITHNPAWGRNALRPPIVPTALSLRGRPFPPVNRGLQPQFLPHKGQRPVIRHQFWRKVPRDDVP